MRVVDLDRDMRDVVPTGSTRDSEFLFARMTERTLRLAAAGPGRRILDAVTAAERVPMGVKTDPPFDRQTLEPLVAAYNAARDVGSVGTRVKTQ